MVAAETTEFSANWRRHEEMTPSHGSIQTNRPTNVEDFWPLRCASSDTSKPVSELRPSSSTPRAAHRFGSPGIAGLAVVTLTAASSAWAQNEAESTPACLAAHEQAQVKRMDADLLAASSLLRACSEASCPAFVRGDCVQWLDEVHEAIPTVSLAASSEDGDESDVRVFVGDKLITEKLDGRPIELNPGVYEFRFERPPAKPVVRQVILREGEKNRLVSVQLALRPEAQPPAPAPAPAPALPATPAVEEYRPVPPVALILGGVAIAGGATAAILAVSAHNAHDNARSDCAPLCSDAEVADIRARAIGSDVSTGIAIAAAAGAGYFFFTRPTRQRQIAMARLRVVPMPQGGYVTLAGGFE